MNKYLLLIITSIIFIACSDKDSMESTSPSPGLIGESLGNVYLEWGIEKENLIKQMKDYEQVSGTGNDYLQFLGKNKEFSVSYKLNNNRLCGTVVLVPSTIDLHNFISGDKGYVLVGGLAGGQIYENHSVNTVASLWQPTSQSETYNAIGFAPISSDAYRASTSIKVQTLDCSEAGMINATVSGNVSGIDSEIEVGILYGRNENLSEVTGKQVVVTSKDNFKITLKGLYDDEKYFYRAFAIKDGIYYMGEIKSFTTKPLTYSIDGKEFKMIKVEGNGHSFSIMQTELPPRGNLTIDGVDYKSVNCHSAGTEAITTIDLNGFIARLKINTGLFFRLPTKSEWQYAAKGGDKSQGYTYSGSNSISDVAWYFSNCSSVQPIAQKMPNELGIYDMTGNYAEICHMYPDNIYESPGKVDGDICGGSWKDYSSDCKITSWKPGVTSGKVPNTALAEKNAIDATYITVRLVYSRNDE